MKIGAREIGPGHPPYIVGEMSGEHCGDKAKAFDIIRAAKEAGADAIKAQLYSPIALAAARGGPHKVLAEGLWKGYSLIGLYTEAHTPIHWFPELFDCARDVGITLFSSVFDEEGVDFLEKLDCPAYKISSFDLTNLPLIRKAASTQKPLIISTGMGSDEDIYRAAVASIHNGSGDRALLHCVSSYPCDVSDANLMRIAELRHRYNATPIGLSDHSLGSTAAVVSIALGASIIEKHITLDRNNHGPDAAFSLEPDEFKKFVQDIKDAYASLGNGERPQSEIYQSLRVKRA